MKPKGLIHSLEFSLLTDLICDTISDRKPDGYWDDPENILREAKELLLRERLAKLPTSSKLAEMGHSSLGFAITNNFSGGYRGIRRELGEKKIVHEIGYWDDTKTIEDEARKFLEGEKLDLLPAYNRIRTLGYGGLATAISVKYPGRISALRKKIGSNIKEKQVEEIREAARKFLEDEGFEILPGASTLIKLGYASLSAKIYRNYPGRIRKIRKDLGGDLNRKSKGYWTNPKNILDEARSLIDKHDLESFPGYDEIKKLNATGLSSAVYRYYPGGLYALRDDLGVKELQRRPGFWHEESNIVAETRLYLTEHGYMLLPTKNRMNLDKASSLVSAIAKYYPGGHEAMSLYVSNLSLAREGSFEIDLIKEIVGDLCDE
ncbi:hypothetical protein HOC96_01810 [archaeon]|nr:hypothetical protein [archaeon]